MLPVGSFKEIQNFSFDGPVRKGVIGKEAAVWGEARLPMGHNFSVWRCRTKDNISTLSAAQNEFLLDCEVEGEENYFSSA